MAPDQEGIVIYICMRSGVVTAFQPKQKAQSDERTPTGAILCVFIVDMTLHLSEMMYKSVTELRTAQTR